MTSKHRENINLVSFICLSFQNFHDRNTVHVVYFLNNISNAHNCMPCTLISGFANHTPCLMNGQSTLRHQQMTNIT